VNLSRTKALGPWLAEGKYVWLALATNSIALIAALRPGTSEPVIRLIGLSLQLCGISTIVWGISATRALFGYATLTTKAKAWLQRFPLRSRNIVVGVGAVVSGIATMKGRLSVTHSAGPNPTFDARLDALEKNIALVRDQITAIETEVEEGFAKVEEKIKHEGHTRQAEDEELQKKVEATGTGGVHISAIGASWLFVGVALSTAAPELATLLN
jgi:hypothetical protein